MSILRKGAELYRTMTCWQINSKSVKIIAVVIMGITILRFLFNIDLLVADLMCILYGKTLEKCGIPYNITVHSEKVQNVNEDDLFTGHHMNLSQSIINMKHYIGIVFESFAILIHLIIIFKWDRFNIRQYLKALPKMAHFIVWVALLIIWMVSSATVESARVGSIHNISSLIIAETEAVLIVILASAWCFIARQTVHAAFIETLGDSPSSSHWLRLMIYQYNTSLALFAMRMTTYFVYDTSLVAQSISRLTMATVNTRNESLNVGESVKEWHSIILVFTCAFRGSLARFFYSKLYQGVTLPNVCSNVPIVIGNREIGVRDEEGGRQHIVPWLTQGEEDRLLASSSHSGFDQTQISSDPIAREPHTKELEDVVIVTNVHPS